MDIKSKTLQQFQDMWISHVGKSIGGKVICRGKLLHKDLYQIPWMGLLLYQMTGRLFSENQIKLFEGMWVVTSYPEVRIWNNKVAALSGTSRSTASLGVCSSLACTEAILFGNKPLLGVFNLLEDIRDKLFNGEQLEDILEKKIAEGKNRNSKPGYGENRQLSTLPGFGRPITREGDERIEPLMRIAENFGLHNGPMIKLAFQIEKTLRALKYKLSMNIVIIMAALSSDQGMTPHQFYCYMALSTVAGMFPCHLDSLDKPEGCFFPLSCDHVSYQGIAERSW